MERLEEVRCKRTISEFPIKYAESKLIKDSKKYAVRKIINRLRKVDIRFDRSGTLTGDTQTSTFPLDSRYSDIDIRLDEVLICSEVTVSSIDKHEWCKIIRNSDLCSATVRNVSSHIILVNEAAVQNEDTIVIECGSEIIPGPDREGYLSYRFKVMPVPEICKKQLKISVDPEDAKCCICLNIWHDVVTIAPCLHNFWSVTCFFLSSGTFSLNLSKAVHDNRMYPSILTSNLRCPNMSLDILEADSSLKRSDEEVALLDSYASIRSNLVIRSGKNRPWKRARSPVDEESDEIDLPCPQCGTELGGFRCNQNTVHLQCHACGGMMPSRTDTNVPQHCLGCDRAFCSAYWHVQSLTRSDFHPICSPETFKPISDRTVSRIPDAAHEKNRHEQDITERCITQMGRTLLDVISEWIAKLNNREIGKLTNS
ncbi:hypothetical protein CJ030_MR6G000776 [Morella rubra]|uniref:E3 ubiquitin-protein ligase CHFR cysteine rich domain-containing protein n=1 Tax=Morella rubra TaxID=262757 RepID=A0A6A1VCN8_9ROSI|nr:hypothetical protein CJ030_MR6G000776 [Morella rubra]